MAQRRMFSKKITDTDRFLEMPLSSQALYFHLNMGADDEGFIDKAKTIQRTVGASDDDMKLLIAKGFLIPFESGVVVIRHWRIHNYIQNDRFQSTLHQDEKYRIEFDESKTANLLPQEKCIQNVSKMETQVRLGKDRLDKDRLNTYSPTSDKKNADEIPYKEIIDFLNERTGRNFRHNSPKTQALIRARWREGYSLVNFRHVIIVKVEDWLGTDFDKYLRPETLFGAKFENYANQKRGKKDNVPEWSQPEYKEAAMTAEEEAKLARIQQEIMDNLAKGGK